MNDPARPFDRALLRRRRDRYAGLHHRHDFLFAHSAEEIAGRLQAILRDFPLALDLGAHQGLHGRALAENPKIGQVFHGELSEELARACPRPALVCDEERLPFADGSLDLVVSGLSLQHVNDLPGALIQIRRALKPDGLFMASLLGTRTLEELREAFIYAEAEAQGGASPRVAPFPDIREAGALLQRAGFALPVTDTETLTVSYESLSDLMNEIRGMGAANVLNERRRTPLLRRTLRRAEEIYRERFSLPDGRIKATFEIVYLSGWAPAPTQQKPLRPGSAKQRLSDALNTEERGAGEKAGFPTPDDGSPDSEG
ncbi:Malonyl-[acyl-carrier protein] O-methyltransferase [Methyloligella halotolerans]|uniref:Malonyl-[acyl-carrier protein] O-methyltransferase n=1 Tax=Methyloligella halotolerans TaxID=1177755 RepID=A0A1E2RZ58_9HYPH|nr:methyltransferase domain-containing protein [Methyloligella halotolerans]ODA67339.1 Malonyl-[acyl-carrier protein] O-methyltransferase [Methyloligella halotolerans]